MNKEICVIGMLLGTKYMSQTNVQNSFKTKQKSDSFSTSGKNLRQSDQNDLCITTFLLR